MYKNIHIILDKNDIFEARNRKLIMYRGTNNKIQYQ